MKTKYLSWEDVIAILEYTYAVDIDNDEDTLKSLAEEYGYYEHDTNQWLYDN